MSQTYEQRLATVEGALSAKNIQPPPGENLTSVAVDVLHALDHLPEIIR